MATTCFTDAPAALPLRKEWRDHHQILQNERLEIENIMGARKERVGGAAEDALVRGEGGEAREGEGRGGE